MKNTYPKVSRLKRVDVIVILLLICILMGWLYISLLVFATDDLTTIIYGTILAVILTFITFLIVKTIIEDIKKT